MKPVFFSMTVLLISYNCLSDEYIYTYFGLVICFMLWAKMVFHAENGLSDGFGWAVLITGCDSGFGHHLAKKLDRMGFAVFAGCLCPEGPRAQSLVEEGSDRMKVLQLDVTKDEDVSLAKDFVQANLPEKGLYAVVNNAGISDWGETEWSTAKDFQKMADVNLFGAIRVTIPFLSLVRASKGRMLYVSSIFSFFNCLNMGAYGVSKRGLEAFADCLRVEMANFGVKLRGLLRGASRNVPFPQAPQVLEDLTKVAPEFNPDEGVQNGIQATVKVGHTPADGQSHQSHLFFLADSLTESFTGVDEKCHIVRQMAKDEHEDHGQDHADRLVLLEVLSFE
uniref:Retinol dehydrogenase 7-like n=1 Tax=Sinocyclocheilus rhinocerous TaxID=307959 RepID=A0A673KDM5_9TELE